jgi:hypothetical protein
MVVSSPRGSICICQIDDRCVALRPLSLVDERLPSGTMHLAIPRQAVTATAIAVQSTEARSSMRRPPAVSRRLDARRLNGTSPTEPTTTWRLALEVVLEAQARPKPWVLWAVWLMTRNGNQVRVLDPARAPADQLRRQ